MEQKLRVIIVSLSRESVVASVLYYVAKSVVPASGTVSSRIAEERGEFARKTPRQPFRNP